MTYKYNNSDKYWMYLNLDARKDVFKEGQQDKPDPNIPSHQAADALTKLSSSTSASLESTMEANLEQSVFDTAIDGYVKDFNAMFANGNPAYDEALEFLTILCTEKVSGEILFGFLQNSDVQKNLAILGTQKGTLPTAQTADKQADEQLTAKKVGDAMAAKINTYVEETYTIMGDKERIEKQKALNATISFLDLAFGGINVKYNKNQGWLFVGGATTELVAQTGLYVWSKYAANSIVEKSTTKVLRNAAKKEVNKTLNVAAKLAEEEAAKEAERVKNEMIKKLLAERGDKVFDALELEKEVQKLEQGIIEQSGGKKVYPKGYEGKKKELENIKKELAELSEEKMQEKAEQAAKEAAEKARKEVKEVAEDEIDNILKQTKNLTDIKETQKAAKEAAKAADKAQKAADKAQKALDKAQEALDKAQKTNYEKALEKRNKYQKSLEKAKEAAAKAKETAEKAKETKKVAENAKSLRQKAKSGIVDKLNNDVKIKRYKDAKWYKLGKDRGAQDVADAIANSVDLDGKSVKLMDTLADGVEKVADETLEAGSKKIVNNAGKNASKTATATKAFRLGGVLSKAFMAVDCVSAAIDGGMMGYGIAAWAVEKNAKNFVKADGSYDTTRASWVKGLGAASGACLGLAAGMWTSGVGAAINAATGGIAGSIVGGAAIAVGALLGLASAALCFKWFG